MKKKPKDEDSDDEEVKFHSNMDLSKFNNPAVSQAQRNNWARISDIDQSVDSIILTSIESRITEDLIQSESTIRELHALDIESNIEEVKIDQ